jgi:hypothetical protein
MTDEQNYGRPIEPGDFYGIQDAIARAIDYLTLDDDPDPKVLRRLRQAFTAAEQHGLPFAPPMFPKPDGSYTVDVTYLPSLPEPQLRVRDTPHEVWDEGDYFTAEQMREAIRAELERCARLCETLDHGAFGPPAFLEGVRIGSIGCANAIRRGEKP